MSNIGSSTLGKMTSSGRVNSKVGQLLQEARRQRGLEIKDIAASTHVRSEYLSALEEGRFSELPENVYTRNFLRLYAEAVGLDEQEVLEHYSLERYGKSDTPRKSVYPSPAYDTSTESYVAGASGAGSKALETERRRRGIGWIVPLLILGLLGLGGFYTWRNFVFPNDDTGGYTLNILDREINLPNFNRAATSGEGTQGAISTDNGTANVSIANVDAESPANDATTSTSLSVPTTGDDSSTASMTTDGGEAVTAVSTDGSDTSTTDGEAGATDVPDSVGNASEGQLITPTLNADGSNNADSSDTASGVEAVTAVAAGDATEEAGDFVMLSIVTEPAGAEVNIDNFYLGTTPISGFPVTPSTDKQLSVTLDGYETVEQSFDGTVEQEFFFTLDASSAASGDRTDVEGDATTVDSITINSDGTVIATDDPSLTPATELQGKAVITIEDGGEAWLEVYQGTSRNGETLVYRVANDSDRFEFDMPVVVRAGRSSLVKVSVNGGLAKPLGPPDEVAQQTFNE